MNYEAERHKNQPIKNKMYLYFSTWYSKQLMSTSYRTAAAQTGGFIERLLREPLSGVILPLYAKPGSIT
jgi:hypothetical protein